MPQRPASSAKSSSRLSAHALWGDLRQLIQSARRQVARAVDTGLLRLYWQVGCRIRQDILKNKRAEYGERILQTLSAKLTGEFGGGYSPRNLASRYQLHLPTEAQLQAELRREVRQLTEAIRPILPG